MKYGMGFQHCPIPENVPGVMGKHRAQLERDEQLPAQGSDSIMSPQPALL